MNSWWWLWTAQRTFNFAGYAFVWVTDSPMIVHKPEASTLWFAAAKRLMKQLVTEFWLRCCSMVSVLINTGWWFSTFFIPRIIWHGWSLERWKFIEVALVVATKQLVWFIIGSIFPSTKDQSSDAFAFSQWINQTTNQTINQSLCSSSWESLTTINSWLSDGVMSAKANLNRHHPTSKYWNLQHAPSINHPFIICQPFTIHSLSINQTSITLLQTNLVAWKIHYSCFIYKTHVICWISRLLCQRVMVQMVIAGWWWH